MFHPGKKRKIQVYLILILMLLISLLLGVRSSFIHMFGAPLAHYLGSKVLLYILVGSKSSNFKKSSLIRVPCFLVSTF